MQPTHSNFIAYLASKRAGAGGRASENSRTNALNTNNSSGWTETNTITNGLTDPQNQEVSWTAHESAPSRALLSHPGNNGSTIQNQSSSRRTEMNTGTIPTIPSGIGTSDEELYHAQQRTSALLSQYYNRQNQIEQRQKLLYVQRMPTPLASSNHLSRSLVQQLQLEQQARQQLPLSSSLSNISASDCLILEVLRQNDDDRQRALLLQDLQRLQRLMSPPPAHHAGLDVLNQRQRINAQNDLQAYLMNLSGSSSAHRELNVNNPMQNGSSPLLSNFDTMTQTRNVNNLRNHLQPSVAGQTILEDISALLSRNSPPAAARGLGQSLAPETNDKKPAASISVPVHSTIDKMVIYRMGRVGKFPTKLYGLLTELKNQGRSDVAAFLPHGRAFGIFNIGEFVKTIMPLHFRMSRYSSFQRQLNLYDFQRITEGPYKGAYHHHLFVEHQPDLLQCMKRSKIKGTSGKQQSTNLDHLATTSHEVPSLLQAASHEAGDDDDDGFNSDDTDAESEITGS